MKSSANIRYLPPIEVPTSLEGVGGPDHPMRRITRQIAGIESGEWNEQLRSHVRTYFDELAPEWHTRKSPERRSIVADALERGLGTGKVDGLAVEIGSGTGSYSSLLAGRFGPVISVDLSMEMLTRAPAGPSHRVNADAAVLPIFESAATAVVLINAFLFPAEVNRVLSPSGVVIWITANGERTPIYLSPEEVVSLLPGRWTGTASRVGEGEWCVLRRA